MYLEKQKTEIRLSNNRNIALVYFGEELRYMLSPILLIQIVCYADDTELLADSLEELEEILKSINEVGEKNVTSK